MPAGIAFWVLMILWFVLGLWGQRGDFKEGRWAGLGGSLLEFALFFLIGWRLFGPVLQ
jgi:hypothetical protein